jgi:FeS assembly SUF system protein
MRVRAGALCEVRMVTQEQVYEALRNCYDPEIPINLVDLGLIYGVTVEDDAVNIVMTLTAPGCPAHSFISEEVRMHVSQIPGVKSAKVQVVWDPPWDPSRMSDAAKKRLGFM